MSCNNCIMRRIQNNVRINKKVLCIKYSWDEVSKMLEDVCICSCKRKRKKKKCKKR